MNEKSQRVNSSLVCRIFINKTFWSQHLKDTLVFLLLMVTIVLNFCLNFVTNNESKLNDIRLSCSMFC